MLSGELEQQYSHNYYLFLLALCFHCNSYCVQYCKIWALSWTSFSAPDDNYIDAFIVLTLSGRLFKW